MEDIMKLILSLFMVVLATTSYAKIERFQATAQDGYITPVSVKDGTRRGAELKAQRALRQHCTRRLNGNIVGAFDIADSYCEYSCSVVACANLCTAVVYGKCSY